MNKFLAAFAVSALFLAPGCRNLWRKHQPVQNTVVKSSEHKAETVRKSGPDGWNIPMNEKE